jgi:hypothetical protein
MVNIFNVPCIQFFFLLNPLFNENNSLKAHLSNLSSS